MNQRVELKLQAGINPHPIEYQFCQLPYDLPGEIWKPFPDIPNFIGLNKRYLVSNKSRVRSLLNNEIRFQRRSGEVGIRDINQKKCSIHAKRVAYLAFGREVVHLYPYTRRQLQINFKLNTGQELDYTEIRDNLSLIDLPGEEWKPIEGFEKAYMISSMGRVKSLFRYLKSKKHPQLMFEHILVVADIPQYYCTHLCDDEGNHHARYIHHLVLKTFSPRTEEEIRLGRDQIDHINGNKHDNRLCNLRWLTISENIRANNNMGKGNCILSAEIVSRLGYEYDQCKSIKQLAEKYHIGTHQIRKALQGKTFSDVKRYLPKLD